MSFLCKAGKNTDSTLKQVASLLAHLRNLELAISAPLQQ